MELTEHVDTVAGLLTDLVAGVRPDQMDAPTPCTEWRVRDLLNHLIGGGHMFAAAFRGEPIGDLDGPMPDLAGDDPQLAWKQALEDFAAAVRSEGALTRTVQLPFAPVPGEMALHIAVTDLTIHGWDLATATGQPYDPPGDLVAAADVFARGFIGPELRGVMFAEEVPARPDASPIERLVAFAGRRP